jgi:ABC-2 type transport system permease protein
MATFNQEFDYRNLLRFPLRFPAFYALSLAYGLFDPASVVTLLWFGCVAAGILLARPQMFLAAGTALALLALASLLLNRVIFSWLEKWLARKRTRETALAIFLLTAVALQLSVPYLLQSGKRAVPYVQPLRPVAALLPPALAASALSESIGTPQSRSSGTAPRAGNVAADLALLAVYPAGLGLLLARRLRQQYVGEELSEVPALRKESPAAVAETKAERGWHLPGMSGPVAAMFEKELRYFLRSGMMLINVLLPVLFVVFFAIMWSRPAARGVPQFVNRAPDLIYPSAVAYVVLVLAQMAYNSFAYDARGVQLLFAAPVRFRDVLLGKNLAYAALFAFDALFILVVLTAFSRPIGALMVAVTLAGLGFVMLIHFTVGNVMSLHFPKAYDFERMKQRARGMTIFVYLVTQIVVMGLAAAVLGLGRAIGGLEIALVLFLVLDAGCLKMYEVMLDRCTTIAEEQREQLTSELCK